MLFLASRRAVGVGPIGFSGTFTKTAAPSGGYVTSDTITLDVPGGNLGSLAIRNYVIVGTIAALEYNLSAGGFTIIADGTSLTGLVSGDTLAIRGGSDMAAGESFQFDLYDDTRGATIGTYILTGS